jgi:predicted ATPase/transcriptional regulator with XRE-family HTH domain
MPVKDFRNKVRAYCRLAAKSQQELAKALNMHHTTLSAKLNGLDNTTLTIPEVKMIVQTLIEWEVIRDKAEVWELLAGLDYGSTVFSETEWQTAPLNRLENKSFQSKATRSKTKPSIQFKSNLPNYTTAFIGRTIELNALVRLVVNEKKRLISLVGMGGTGKTRLSVEVCRKLAQEQILETVFVRLAEVIEPEHVLTTLAETLELKAIDGQPLLENLQTSLKNKPLLLVLDNFEQVIAATPLLTKLLAGTNSLQIMLTSRVELPLSNQHQFQINPFSLPDYGQISRKTNLLEILAENEAVQLFELRTQMIKQDFRLDKTNVMTVANICRQLEGLPLGIELAATRLKYISIQNLEQQLTRRLSLIPNPQSNLPARHQTLRAVLQWSYDLLSVEEKRIFELIAVFRGGCTVEMLKQISAEQHNSGLSLNYIVQWLLTKNLVSPQDSDSAYPRYFMLETVREFALEELNQKNTLNFFQKRHAEYF